MKITNAAKGLVIGASFLFAASVFAGRRTTLHVYDNLKANGTSIAPGKYELEWDGTGPDVQLDIRQGKTTVATLPAHLTSINFPYQATGYSTRKEADGSVDLTSVFIAGKKYVLEIGQESAATPAATEKPVSSN